MPVPSPRNSIRIARGNFSDLNANKTAFGEGEFIYAIDQDRFYTYDSGLLAPVGIGTVGLAGIDELNDVDTTTIAPGVGQVLKWDGSNWAPADDSNTDAVTSVNTQTGDVVLSAADVGAATTAQGALADSATQPADNVSTLTNDAGYITLAEIPGTDLSYTASTRIIASSTGSDATLPEVVASGDSGLITGADKAKLDGIESGATADQTDAEIKTAYENNADTNAFTDSEKSKLAGIAAGAEVNTVDSVAGKTGNVTLVKADVGLGNVDNTSDANKPISTATQTALDGKATTAQGALADSAVQPTDSIDILSDVDITTNAPTNGQALIWDNAGGNFVPGEAGLVDSVNTQTGDVVLDTDDISEGAVNLYSQWDAATGGINYAGGNVGIGASVPARPLHIAGGSPVIRIQDTGGTNRYTEVFQVGSALYFDARDNTSSGAVVYRGISATEFARITADGDFGVGTGTPTEKLEVTGNAILDQADATLKIKSGTTGATGAVNFTLNTDSTVFGGIDLAYDNRATTGVRLFSDNYPVTIQSQVNSPVIFRRGSTETVRISSSGDVGIGENNPGAKLEVNGTIKATDINFTGLSTFADDSAAGTGGLTAGDVYKTSTGELRIKL